MAAFEFLRVSLGKLKRKSVSEPVSKRVKRRLWGPETDLPRVSPPPFAEIVRERTVLSRFDVRKDATAMFYGMHKLEEPHLDQRGVHGDTPLARCGLHLLSVTVVHVEVHNAVAFAHVCT